MRWEKLDGDAIEMARPCRVGYAGWRKRGGQHQVCEVSLDLLGDGWLGLGDGDVDGDEETHQAAGFLGSSSSSD